MKLEFILDICRCWLLNWLTGTKKIVLLHFNQPLVLTLEYEKRAPHRSLTIGCMRKKRVQVSYDDNGKKGPLYHMLWIFFSHPPTASSLTEHLFESKCSIFMAWRLKPCFRLKLGVLGFMQSAFPNERMWKVLFLWNNLNFVKN